MHLLDFIPILYRPFVEIALFLTVITAFFAWMWPGIRSVCSSMLSYVSMAVAWDDVLTLTIGHALVTGAMALAVTHFAKGQMAIMLLGGWIVWTFLATNTYESIMSRQRTRAPHEILWNIISILMLLVWLALYSVLVWQNVELPVSVVLWESIRWLVAVPYVDFIVAFVCVILVLPLTIQSIFAALGILEFMTGKQRPLSP